jgi:hypothetical protein
MFILIGIHHLGSSRNFYFAVTDILHTNPVNSMNAHDQSGNRILDVRAELIIN